MHSLRATRSVTSLDCHRSSPVRVFGEEPAASNGTPHGAAGLNKKGYKLALSLSIRVKLPSAPGTLKKSMHHKETGLMPRQAFSWLLTLLSVCSVGAIYAVNNPTAVEPEYCTLFHHQVRVRSTNSYLLYV